LGIYDEGKIYLSLLDDEVDETPELEDVNADVSHYY